MQTAGTQKRSTKPVAPMRFPNEQQVQVASQLQLARWTLKLGTPGTVDEMEIVQLISQRFKGWTPGLRKKADWTNRIN